MSNDKLSIENEPIYIKELVKVIEELNKDVKGIVINVVKFNELLTSIVFSDKDIITSDDFNTVKFRTLLQLEEDESITVMFSNMNKIPDYQCSINCKMNQLKQMARIISSFLLFGEVLTLDENSEKTIH